MKYPTWLIAAVYLMIVLALSMMLASCATKEPQPPAVGTFHVAGMYYEGKYLSNVTFTLYDTADLKLMNIVWSIVDTNNIQAKPQLLEYNGQKIKR